MLFQKDFLIKHTFILFPGLLLAMLLGTSSILVSQQPVSIQKELSIREIHNQFSDTVMALAHTELQKLEKTIERGPYFANFRSLDAHPTPEWYQDARFGIFFDWGLYSVAGYGPKGWGQARYPDWYLHHMYTVSYEFHQRVWGKAFERDDFIPLFTASNFDAEALVNLVKTSGAKYLVPFNKHHDGYCLWDSKFTRRDVVDMMPGRDLTAEIVAACRKDSIPIGFYFSVEDYEHPVIRENGDLAIRYWSDGMAPDNAGMAKVDGEIFGNFDDVRFERIISGKVAVRSYVNDYIVPQAKEFIDQYDPDILWFDGEWQRPATYYKTPEIAAYFYNQAEGRKQVAVNDRFGLGSRGLHGDFYTSETDEVVNKTDSPWEENRSMSESYGYNQTDSLENYLTADELIEMLVRIVAKGGNLNLIVNPDGTGRVNDLQKNLLSELGKWLAVNGEAIFGSRPYEELCDNTQLGQPVWYTMSKDSTYGYAIILDWPKSETFICRKANIKWDTEVYLLGHNKPLRWVDTSRKNWALSAKIPEEMISDPTKRPCQYAWVLRFEYDKENRFGE